MSAVSFTHFDFAPAGHQFAPTVRMLSCSASAAERRRGDAEPVGVGVAHLVAGEELDGVGGDQPPARARPTCSSESSVPPPRVACAPCSSTSR
jgi:hypothetical protein